MPSRLRTASLYPEEKLRGRAYRFEDQFVRTGEQADLLEGLSALHIQDAEKHKALQILDARIHRVWALYILDSAKQPKGITLSEFRWRDEKGNVKKQEFPGIYKLDGDRLTIAYRLGGPRPEKFESVPGSGVTLLVLERPKPAAEPGGAPAPEPLNSTAEQAPQLAGPAGLDEAPTPFAFRTTTITRGGITQTVEATGTIEPDEVIDIGAEVTGTVVRLGDDPRGNSDASYKDKTIDYGSPVEQNTILARIDDTLYKVRLDQQKAGCAGRGES